MGSRRLLSSLLRSSIVRTSSEFRVSNWTCRFSSSDHSCHFSPVTTLAFTRFESNNGLASILGVSRLGSFQLAATVPSFTGRFMSTQTNSEESPSQDGSSSASNVPSRIKFKRLDKTARHIMQILDKEAVEEVRVKRDIPDIRPGYIVQLKVEVPENKRRVSILKGIVIARRNAGLNTTFRIRRLVAGVGVESLFPLYSPNIKEIKVLDKKKGGQDLYVKVAASDLDNVEIKGQSSKKKLLGIIVVCGVLVIGMLILGLFFCMRKERRNKGLIIMLQNEVDRNRQRKEEMDLPTFDFRTITNATDNFSSDNKLGEGGFGPVYKGKLMDGQDIAVKRLSQNSGQGLSELKNEVIIIAKLQHQIVSGKKNRGFSDPDHQLNLLGHAWRLWVEEKPLELIDGSLEGQDLYVRVAASDKDYIKDNGNSRKKIVIIAVVSAMSVIALTLLGLSIYLWKKKTGPGMTKTLYWKDHKSKMRRENMDLPTMDFSSVAKATDNFSGSNILGKGGFGLVYKGVLDNGQEIAVKRLSKNSGQGPEEFRNEVMLIAKLQHRNLVKLLSCSIQNDEKLLIYEFMSNRSLDYFIFDQTKSMLLDWTKRFQIISGIARGLLYLHQDSRLKIIHRDLKTSNVLLDDDMNPKISDFGLARIFCGDQLEANTKRVIGTHGYMPPEYVSRGSFSIKTDVFSFGVIVMEIVSRRKNREIFDPQRDLNLLGHAWRLWTEERPLELIDESLGDSVTVAEVLRCDKRHINKKLAVSLSVITVFIIVILGYAIYLRRRKLKIEVINWKNHNGETEKTDIDLPTMNLSTIAIATNNFSFCNILGEGGYGPVYKGSLPNGQHIAVKRLANGYMSPEYALHGNFSIKSDVFSFGAIILEIISGRKNRDFSDPHHHLNLLGHAWRLWSEEKALELIDESIGDSITLAEASRSIIIGLLCVQERPEDRPDMSSVVLMLNGEKGLPNPKQPGFYPHVGFSSSESRGNSTNEISMTLDAR
ncbi:hypothetical protein L6164_018530 [Bauhinia variegata]|uniref:Uncharacterized protein n=1 Tax=Bauhinia variegata TaxID=167791 RepID=A0ACB9NBP8_BAUVA|nr:hypothetical protein L6164_018530 [Bauhinia variegata]